jgi:hypothetical protein
MFTQDLLQPSKHAPQLRTVPFCAGFSTTPLHRFLDLSSLSIMSLRLLKPVPIEIGPTWYVRPKLSRAEVFSFLQGFSMERSSLSVKSLSSSAGENLYVIRIFLVGD